MSALVSIIIPTFNSGKYLNRCLKSIEMQTYRPLEVVIVDGGSGDETASIAKHYQEKFTLKFFVIGRSTQSEARNYGLRHATGKYIAFCDSDDFYLPEKIQKQITDLEISGADVCYFDVLHFYTGQEDRFFLTKHPEHHDMLAECIANQTVNLNSVIVRKSFLDINNLQFPSGEMGKYGEDGNFIFQLALHRGNFKKIDGHYSVVEVRKDSHTQWDAQWKMKYYAIEYRKNALPFVGPYHHKLTEKSIKNLELKLIISYIIAGKYSDARHLIKHTLKPAFALISITILALLKFIPRKWTNWFVTMLWSFRRSGTKNQRLSINANLKKQLAFFIHQ